MTEIVLDNRLDSRMHDHGFDPPHLSLKHLREVARLKIIAGITPTCRAHFRWRPEEDERLLKMRGEGFSFREISRALPGRSIPACHARWHTLLARGLA